MSIEVIATVFEFSLAEGADRLILLAYANHADKETGICWPSNDTIAKEARCHVQTVKTSKKHLIEINEMRLLERGSNRKGVCKTDTLQITAIPKGSCRLPSQDKGSETLPLRVVTDYPKGSDRLPQRVARDIPQPSYEPSLNGRGAHSRPYTPKKKAAEKAEQPAFAELLAYGRSIQLPDEEAYAISDYWMANGFRTGKNPIKDWQASVRTWKRNMSKFSRTGGSHKPKGFCNL